MNGQVPSRLGRRQRLRAAVDWRAMSQDDRSTICQSGILTAAAAAVTAMVSCFPAADGRIATRVCAAMTLMIGCRAIARVVRRYRWAGHLMYCTSGCGCIWTARDEAEAFRRWGRVRITARPRAFVRCPGVDGRAEHRAPISWEVARGQLRDRLAVHARAASAYGTGGHADVDFARRAGKLVSIGVGGLSGAGSLHELYDERSLYAEPDGVPWPQKDREALYRLLAALALDEAGYRRRAPGIPNATYILNGPNARVVQGSVDTSVNVVADGDRRTT